MLPSQKCLNLVKQFEGCRLHAYLDARPTHPKWTIGYGVTGFNIGPLTVWTQEQADYDLNYRLNALWGAVACKIGPLLSQNQCDALASLIYNIGIEAFRTSTLLKLLNARDFVGAANQFLVWNKAEGQVLEGLIRRRGIEKTLFICQT